MELDIPSDRKGEFEPQVIKKHQNTVTQDMEEKIISMYAKGMTTADIESHMRELYDIEIFDSTISRISDKILPIVKEWQERPLENILSWKDLQRNGVQNIPKSQSPGKITGQIWQPKTRKNASGVLPCGT